MCRIVGHEMSVTCMSHGLEHAAAATASPGLPTSCMYQSHIVSFYRNYAAPPKKNTQWDFSSYQSFGRKNAFPHIANGNMRVNIA